MFHNDHIQITNGTSVQTKVLKFKDDIWGEFWKKIRVYWIARKPHTLVNVWRRKPLFSSSCLPTDSFSTFENSDGYKAGRPSNRVDTCVFSSEKVDGKRILTFFDKIDGIAPVYVTLNLWIPSLSSWRCESFITEYIQYLFF